MHSLSLWQIKPDDEEKSQACQILEQLILIGRYEDYCYIIGRLLQHFPSRQAEKDAIIISDLASDCIEENVSLCALIHICNKIRKEATKENPFLPPSGEILRRAIEQTKSWQNRLESLLNPMPLVYNKPAISDPCTVVSWFGKNWKDFDEKDKNDLREHLKTMPLNKREDYQKYLINMVGVPPSFFH
jgi:hypothetical protein